VSVCAFPAMLAFVKH